MEEKLRVLQIGCGKMSKYIMRYVYEKGGEIVGAVDINHEIIGQDIGKIMECDEKGVVISSLDYLNDLLKKLKPSIAIVTTMSTMNDILEVSRICLKNGVNVITTCEEAFFPSNSNPNLFKELDTLAKANHCTITGCGYQDVFWGNMVTSVCGSTHKITKIKGSSCYNVEDYGIALANVHGVGLTKEEFAKKIAKDNQISEEELAKKMDNCEFFPSYMWNVVGWLSAKLGFHITDIKQVCVPIFCEKELHSNTLDITLLEGQVRGMSAIIYASTKENVLFEVECVGKVYLEDEYDVNEWTIFGEPTTHIVNEKPNTVMLTCADIVNRLTDVINSRPGFVSTSEMESPKYIVEKFL